MEHKNSIAAAKKVNIRFITTTALFITLTYVFTALINIKLPISVNGGLIHLGNVPLYFAAFLFGKKSGALAGGIGMAMFDLLSGWTIWAPFTLVICGAAGYTAGAMTERRKGFGWYLLAIIVTGIMKIIGYYTAEVILYGNFIVPLTSIPGDVIQMLAAIVIVLPLVKRLDSAAQKLGLK